MLTLILIMYPCYLLILFFIGWDCHMIGKKNSKYPLFMTLSKEQREDSEVLLLQKKYQKGAKCILLVFTLLSFSCFFFGQLAFLHTAFLFIWIYGLLFVVYRWNKKHAGAMYELKKERGWLKETNKEICLVDTVVSRLKKKMPVSVLWFAVPFWIEIGAILIWLVYYPNSIVCAIFTLASVPVTVLCVFWYHSIVHAKTKVYSEDSSINLALNRVNRRGWSACCITEATICAAYSLLTMLRTERYARLLRASESDDGFLTFLLVSSAAVTIVAILPVFLAWKSIQRARKEMNIAGSFSEDEDAYWKNGYYYNPDTTNTGMVENRIGLGMTANMASTWGKITKWALILTAVLCVGICIVTAPFDICNVKANIGTNEIRFKVGPFYRKTVTADKIDKVTVYPNIPKMIRVVGTATDHLALGDYTAEGLGNGTAIVDLDAESFLCVEKTDGKKYFIAVEKKEIMQEILEFLQKNVTADVFEK